MLQARSARRVAGQCTRPRFSLFCRCIGSGAIAAAVERAFRLSDEARRSRQPLASLLPAPGSDGGMAAAAPAVAVAMSGGVDSSVAALVIRCTGARVLAVHMVNWDEADEAPDALGGTACLADREWSDVQRVCAQLGIGRDAQFRLRLEREYWLDVFEPSLERLERGLTPNPDWLCNRHIKFDALSRQVLADPPRAPGQGSQQPRSPRAVDAEWLCTGHYARLDARLAADHNHDHYRGRGQQQLLAAADSDKDQSYFLSGVRPAALRRVLLPLGEMSKVRVRELARAAGLATAEKQESMGICFVGKRDFGSFVSNYVPARRGPMLGVETGEPLRTANVPRSVLRGSRDGGDDSDERRERGAAAVASARECGRAGAGGDAKGGGDSNIATRMHSLHAGADSPAWHHCEHDGITQYTLGQRARLPGKASKWFIAAKCLRPLTMAGGGLAVPTTADGAALGGAVFAAEGTAHMALFCDSAQLRADGFNWLDDEARAAVAAAGPCAAGGGAAAAEPAPLRCLARLRHRGALVPCSVRRVRAGTVPWLQRGGGECGCCADVCLSASACGEASAALLGLRRALGVADSAAESAGSSENESRRAGMHVSAGRVDGGGEADEGGAVAEATLVLDVRFDEPQRAVAPSQILALYARGSTTVRGAAGDELVCLGGGAVLARGPSYLAMRKPLPAAA
eukprot:g66.t1